MKVKIEDLFFFTIAIGAMGLAALAIHEGCKKEV